MNSSWRVKLPTSHLPICWSTSAITTGRDHLVGELLLPPVDIQGQDEASTG